MSFQSDIYAALVADETISQLVGDRVFADVADGSTITPYLVYQVITTRGETPHDGGRDIEFPLVQFSAWADGKAAAIQVASAVNELLDGNTLSGNAAITLTFQDQQGRHENETNLFGEIIDFQGVCNRN
jgi:hypothetical protein